MAEDVRRIVAEFTARNRAAGEIAAYNRSLNTTKATAMAFSRSMLQMAGLGGGLYAFKRILGSIKDSTLEQESAEKQLQAAMGTSIQKYKDYAAQIQKVTIYGDEQILSQMAYARNLGVTADKLEEATTAAVGLAAKYRLDLKTSFMLVGRASQGQTQMLTRYGIVLDESLSTQEKFNAILKIGADNFYLAEAAAKETEGAISQLKNSWSDLEEQIGERYIPTAVSAITVTKQLIQATNELQKRETQSNYLSGLKRGLTLPLRTDIFQLFNIYNDIQKIIDKANEFKGGAGGGFGGKGISGGWEEMTTGEGAAAQIEAAKKQIADAQKLIETTRKSLITRLTLTAKFYEDMGDYGKDYLKLRERLLDQQVAQYKETINDEVLLGRWKESELEKIEKDITEIHRQETIKRLKESDKIKDGFKAAYMEEGFQLKTWGDIGYDVAYALRDSIAGSLRDIIMESKNATEAMKGFGLSIADAIVQIMAMEAAKRLVSGAGNLFGIELAAGKHGGGMGYERPSFVEAVPASVLARAPSLHTGTDEYYAKLKYNEGVFTPGQMKNLGPAGGNVSVNVNVINNSSQPVNAKQEKTSFDGKGYTIAVVLEDLRQNGPIRKSMRRGR